MLVAVKRYIEILSFPEKFTRTLGAVEVLMRDTSGRPKCFVGNRSAVFRIRHEGRDKMLKCYTVPKPNLRRIYGGRCLRDELLVPAAGGGAATVDAVLCDWVEGDSLRGRIAAAAGDERAMKALSREFDRFAVELLDAEWAHGDLKPDNIIVDAEGRMHAIDFDAMYRPDLADLQSDESGTAAFQHPLRTASLYDKTMDDYPIALISTALHALAADSSLGRRFDTDDNLLFDPSAIAAGRCEALTEVLSLFARRGMGAEYRVAKLLESKVPALNGLRRLMGLFCGERWPAERADGRSLEAPQLECGDGRWGYVSGGQFVIAPLYDSGFEFSEGLAAVRLGGCFHYIDTEGRTVLNVGECEYAKPFRGGYAVVMRNGERTYVGKDGRPIYPPPMDLTGN